MSRTIIERGGSPILVCDENGPAVSSTQHALDLIGEAFDCADAVAVPCQRFDETFFSLETGLAGEITQKFVNYRIRLYIVGDVSFWTDRSSALRDFVHEANQGRHIRFIADLNDIALSTVSSDFRRRIATAKLRGVHDRGWPSEF
ncbi:DUF4180 domain-containing protein [Haloglycomyces albus]|uniref:DUF4180 domain-containing protein n=1 Tax=Haloglycomyces albus TaxID=526067 RepID=UPI00046D2E6A|nr:DUF4180 domain-containing protein [Haloglycomyces albus]